MGRSGAAKPPGARSSENYPSGQRVKGVGQAGTSPSPRRPAPTTAGSSGRWTGSSVDSLQDGDRTARRLWLVAEAAKYDDVTFSWRRSDGDAWAQVPLSAVTLGGEALPAWPVPLTGGKN